jgi:hypothetical protein
MRIKFWLENRKETRKTKAQLPDNIKMDLKEIEREDVYWIDVADQDKGR